MPKRIALCTFGSLGDLHPYLAIGLALRARGHEPVIAASPCYRPTVEELGLSFHPVRPDLPDPAHSAELMHRAMDPRQGPEFVVRELVLGSLQASYEDLLPLSRTVDALVSHPLTFAVPIVAEATGIPWLGSALQPVTLFSARDLPVFESGALWHLFRRQPLPLRQALLHLIKARTRPWMTPVADLRHALGLPLLKHHPMFDGQFSSTGNLALFSPVLGQPQSDWPVGTVQTGFPFYRHFKY